MEGLYKSQEYVPTHIAHRRAYNDYIIAQQPTDDGPDDPPDPDQLFSVLVSVRSFLKFLNSHVVSTTTIACLCLVDVNITLPINTYFPRHLSASLYDTLRLYWRCSWCGGSINFLHSCHHRRWNLSIVIHVIFHKIPKDQFLNGPLWYAYAPSLNRGVVIYRSRPIFGKCLVIFIFIWVCSGPYVLVSSCACGRDDYQCLDHRKTIYVYTLLFYFSLWCTAHPICCVPRGTDQETEG